ncbi:hypothetical protein E2C01_037296 [Portunus trituberculatus]|uniref:Uncharacterized protein n=1 Tax=Portunus trituberculatus TaxID=210409 RepID=A0A5B7FGP6_PORTR|nr:hypothetical protein [Portunus trituberculatus]
MWKTEFLNVPQTLTFMILECPLICLSFPYGPLFPVYPSRLVIPFPTVFLYREDSLLFCVFLPVW